MSALPLLWFEDESPRDFLRWAAAATVVVGIHAGAISYYLARHEPVEIGDEADIVTVELAPALKVPEVLEAVSQMEVLARLQFKGVEPMFFSV